MVDNTEQLKKLMDFSDDKKFYYLQLLARSKDGHNKATKVVKNYFIQNEEYFDSHEQQIKDLCMAFKARAYLRLNRRSYKDVAFENLETIAKLIRYGQFEAVMSSFSKSCGRTNAETSKIWVVDIDDDFVGLSTKETIRMVVSYIEELQSEIKEDYKVLDVVRTVNGHHILTNPFRLDKFSEHFPTLSKDDVKKDNPTILYANV